MCLVGRTPSWVLRDQCTAGMLQHWAGLFGFMASFRRPLHSIGQEVFAFVSSFGESPVCSKRVPEVVVDELLVGAMLAPVAFVSFSATIRNQISISDVSETGGAAAEASSFNPGFGRDSAEDAEDWVADVNERVLSCLDPERPISPPEVEAKEGTRACNVCGKLAQAEEGLACAKFCEVFVCS